MAETLPTTVVRYVPIMEVACLSGRRVVIGTLPIGCLLQSLTPQSRILWLKTSTAPQACLRFEWLSKRDMGPASGGVRVVVYTDLLSLYMINRQATVRPDNRFVPRPGGGICNNFPMVLLVRTKLIFGETYYYYDFVGVEIILRASWGAQVIPSCASSSRHLMKRINNVLLCKGSISCHDSIGTVESWC